MFQTVSKTLNFFYNYSNLFPSKYSPWLSTHFSQHCFHRSIHLENSSCRILLSCSWVLFYLLCHLKSLSFHQIFEVKEQPEITGSQVMRVGGWGRVVMVFLAKKARMRSAVWAQGMLWWWKNHSGCNPTHLQFLHQNLLTRPKWDGTPLPSHKLSNDDWNAQGLSFWPLESLQLRLRAFLNKGHLESMFCLPWTSWTTHDTVNNSSQHLHKLSEAFQKLLWTICLISRKHAVPFSSLS